MAEIINHSDIDREGIAIAIHKKFLENKVMIGPDANILSDPFCLKGLKDVSIDKESIKTVGADTYSFQATCTGSFSDASRVKSTAKTILKGKAEFILRKDVLLCKDVSIDEWRRDEDVRVNLPGLIDNSTITQND